jgi:hypothetical protein
VSISLASKPAYLPVQGADQGDQSRDCQALGITVPISLLDRADEVIESLSSDVHWIGRGSYCPTSAGGS